MKKILTIALISLMLGGCDVLTEVANQVEVPGNVTPSLSEQDVVSGLKEVLRVSTDTAVSKVSKKNGFLGDNLIKIMLPPEAKVITDNKDNAILKTLGVSKMIDDVVLRMNRSAEEASKKAAPIFVNAIKGMNFKDAFSILKGTDTAATHYFRMNTFSQLYKEFNPVIKKYLDKDIVGGISTNDAWNTLTSAYNKAAKFSSSLTPVETKLDDYVTKKTINGVFLKLADQEKQIRKDPAARVTDILKKLFR